MTWKVYGLNDPVTRQLFYVGLTKREWWARQRQHASDRESAAYERIKHLRENGLEPICIIFKEFWLLEEARLFERDLIVLLDEVLTSREARYSLGGRVHDRYQYQTGHSTGAFDAVTEPFDDGWEQPKLHRRGKA